METPTKKGAPILFDDVFEYIGHFEMYQFLLYILLGITAFYPAYEVMALTFLGASPEYWCKVDRLENLTHAQQKYIAIPRRDDGEYDGCRYYDLAYSDFSDKDFYTWDRGQWNETETVECDQWVYDRSQYVSTAVTEWDVTCNKEWLMAFSSTIWLFGIFFGAPMSGFVGDKIGRYPALAASMVVHIGLLVATPFAPHFWVYVLLKFLTSISNAFGYLTGFVIMMEILGPKYRTAAGCFFQNFFSLGFMVLPFMAYYCRDFVKLQWIMLGPCIVCISYFWLVPESPRWLVAKGKNKKAMKILEHIAAVNNRTLPEGLELKTPAETEEKGTFGDLFRSPILRRELLIMYLAWFTNSLIYYGLSLNTGNLVGSIYLNTFLTGVVEIPANLLCMLMMAKIGRRITLGAGFLFGGLSCLGMIPLLNNKELGWLMTTLAMLGKVAITITFTNVYVFTAELFPTPVRHLAVGSSSMMARISGLASPYMGKPMMDIWQPLPSVIFGVFSISSGLLAFLLPETPNRKMPDTIEEAEEIGRLGRKKKEKAYSVTSNFNPAFTSEEPENDKV